MIFTPYFAEAYKALSLRSARIYDDFYYKITGGKEYEYQF